MSVEDTAAAVAATEPLTEPKVNGVNKETDESPAATGDVPSSSSEPAAATVEATDESTSEEKASAKHLEQRYSRFEQPLGAVNDGATAEQRAQPNSYTPTDDELKEAVTDVMSFRNDLGAGKILAKLKTVDPHWSVSEKRVRKLVQKLRPAAAATEGEGTNGEQPTKPTYAVSKNDPKIAALIPPDAKYELRRVDQTRGRGLFTKASVGKGILLFEEDAWVYSPTA